MKTITDEQMVEKYSQMTNKATAMRSVMNVVAGRLSQSHTGLEVQDYTERQDVSGYFEVLPDYGQVAVGYQLVQKTQLPQPRVIQKKESKLWGLIQKPELVQTHEERRLAYGKYDNGADVVKVTVNDADVLQACEEVAAKTGRVKVLLTI
jgi:hypothetical protein